MREALKTSLFLHPDRQQQRQGQRSLAEKLRSSVVPWRRMPGRGVRGGGREKRRGRLRRSVAMRLSGRESIRLPLSTSPRPSPRHHGTSHCILTELWPTTSWDSTLRLSRTVTLPLGMSPAHSEPTSTKERLWQPLGSFSRLRNAIEKLASFHRNTESRSKVTLMT